MDTILNLGLNDLRTQTLAEQTNADFAYNCYRRLLQMFADVVYGISKDEFDNLLGYFERNAGKQAKDFTLEEHQALIDQYKQLYREHHQTFPKALKNNSMLLSRRSSSLGITPELRFTATWMIFLMT